MLKQRVITALALVIVLLAALTANNPIFWQLTISAVILIGFWEWCRFCQITDLSHKVVSFILFLACFVSLQMGLVPMQWLVVSSCLLWLGLLLFTVTDKLLFLHNRIIKLFVGIWVLTTVGHFIIELKQLEYGFLWILCFLVPIWAADIGAYFSGKRFGKTKLAPSVSPGKTVEGLFGGLLFVAVLFVPILVMNLELRDASLLLLTVMVTALVSVGGDLFESKLKRYVNLKDSSQILPGHGGVLDRIDSLLAGAPFFMLGLIVFGFVSLVN